MTISTTYGLAVTPYLEEECCFCLEEYKRDEKIYLLACEHLIHADCLVGQNQCPLCRAHVLPFVDKPESGYAFYDSLYQSVMESKEKAQWTSDEVGEQVEQLKKTLSKHHEWNHHSPVQNFNELCVLLKKPYAPEAQAFFQDVVQHPDYQLMDSYLEDQNKRLVPRTPDTDPVWEAISKVASYFFCIPVQPDDD